MPSFDAVIQKYKSLRLGAIAESLQHHVGQAEENEISFLDFADILADHELRSRDKKRVALNMKRAGFPVAKWLDEFDYRFQTTITKRQVSRLLDFSFIDNRENLVFIGPPGVGKTHLATGIGIKAVETGYKVFFTTAMALIEALDLAEIKGQLKKKISTILKFDLVIIDEL